MAENAQELVDFEFPDTEKEEARPAQPAVEAKSDLEIEVEDDTPPSGIVTGKQIGRAHV